MAIRGQDAIAAYKALTEDQDVRRACVLMTDYRVVDNMDEPEVDQMLSICLRLRQSLMEVCDNLLKVKGARRAQSVSGKTAGLRAAQKKQDNN